jgi:hypothetical protein
MSTKQQFLVQINDHPGTLKKRVEVRQTHLAVVGENQAVRAGGISLHGASGADNNRCFLL